MHSYEWKGEKQFVKTSKQQLQPNFSGLMQLQHHVYETINLKFSPIHPKCFAKDRSQPQRMYNHVTFPILTEGVEMSKTVCQNLEQQPQPNFSEVIKLQRHVYETSNCNANVSSKIALNLRGCTTSSPFEPPGGKDKEQNTLKKG